MPNKHTLPPLPFCGVGALSSGEEAILKAWAEDYALAAVRAALAALVAQPPVPSEPDMRHPKIQRLIGAKARCEIELRLVEDLLDEGPDVELSAMCMEYWGPMHDKLKAALSQPPVPVPDYRGALADLVAEFKRIFPIYYYAEPWAHDRNAALLNSELLLAAAPQQAPAKEQA